MKDVLSFITEHWAIISGILVLVLPRLIPTGKNYDLATAILKLLDKVVPNLKKGGGKHVANFIILGVLLLSYGNSNAQLNTTAKAYFSTNVADTAAVQTARTTLQSSNGNTGALYFDEVRNKWRVWNGSAYVNLISTATGTIGGSIAATQVAYGSGANTIKGENALQYIEGTNTLRVENISSNGTNLGINSTNGINITTAIAGITVDSNDNISLLANSGVGIDGGTNINLQAVSGTGDTFISNWGDNGYFATNPAIELIGIDLVGGVYSPYLGIEGLQLELGIHDNAGSDLYTGVRYTTDGIGGFSSNFLGHHFFNPTATLPGVNLGTFAGDPSTLVNGDVWYNSITGKFRGRQGGSSVDLVTAAGGTIGGSIANNQVAVGTGVNTVGGTANFQYSTASETLSITSGSNSTTMDGDGTFIASQSGSGNSVTISGPNEDISFTNSPATFNHSGGTVTVSAVGDIVSGTWTPTVTGTNKVSTTTAYLCNYMRVGDVVTVSGRFDANVTSTGSATRVSISLPIASALSGASSVGGTVCQVDTGLPGAINGSGSALQVTWNSVATGNNQFMMFHATYVIN